MAGHLCVKPALAVFGGIVNANKRLRGFERNERE